MRSSLYTGQSLSACLRTPDIQDHTCARSDFAWWESTATQLALESALMAMPLVSPEIFDIHNALWLPLSLLSVKSLKLYLLYCSLTTSPPPPLYNLTSEPKCKTFHLSLLNFILLDSGHCSGLSKSFWILALSAVSLFALHLLQIWSSCFPCVNLSHQWKSWDRDKDMALKVTGDTSPGWWWSINQYSLSDVFHPGSGSLSYIIIQPTFLHCVPSNIRGYFVKHLAAIQMHHARMPLYL